MWRWRGTTVQSIMCKINMALTARGIVEVLGNQLPPVEKRIWQELLSETDNNDENGSDGSRLIQFAQAFVDHTSTWDYALYCMLHLVNTKALEYNYQVYAELFRGIDTDCAKSLAKKSVDALGLSQAANTELVYGEVDFHSFASILERVNPKEGDVFVDLGHGTGKALVCALLLCGNKFSRVHGVELLEDLYLKSTEVVATAQKRISESSDLAVASSGCAISVCQGDMLSPNDDASSCIQGVQYDWGQAGKCI
jgi:hypothetical protein